MLTRPKSVKSAASVGGVARNSMDYFTIQTYGVIVLLPFASYLLVLSVIFYLYPSTCRADALPCRDEERQQNNR